MTVYGLVFHTLHALFGNIELVLVDTVLSNREIEQLPIKSPSPNSSLYTSTKDRQREVLTRSSSSLHQSHSGVNSLCFHFFLKLFLSCFQHRTLHFDVGKNSQPGMQRKKAT